MRLLHDIRWRSLLRCGKSWADDELRVVDERAALPRRDALRVQRRAVALSFLFLLLPCAEHLVMRLARTLKVLAEHALAYWLQDLAGDLRIWKRGSGTCELVYQEQLVLVLHN